MSSVTLPNGPRAPRAVLELMLMARPLESLARWQRRYGDPFTLGRGGRAPAVFSGDPRGVQAVLMADPAVFEPRAGDKVLRFLLGNSSVFYLNGAEHQHERRRLSPPMQGERLRASIGAITEIADRATSEWTPGRSFRVRDFTQDVTLRVIARLVLGRDTGARVDEVRRRIRALWEFTSPLLPAMALRWLPRRDWGLFSPWGQLFEHRRVLDRLLLEEIRERRSAPDDSRPDALGTMMAPRDDASPLASDQALRDKVMALLFAGHEAASSAIAWALFEIHRHDDVRAKLLAEIDGVDADPNPDSILNLPYLTAVCQETLRLYPGVISVPRVLRQPLEFMGFRFEPGVTLIPCIPLTHRRADLYPDPLRFRPDRFLERRYSPYEFWPFGAGHRRCLGMALAFAEMKFVLVTILTRWRLAAAVRGPMRPVRRGVITAPPRGMRLVAVGRRH